MRPPDRKRLARLQRLEVVRALAKQTALAAAAEAEGTLAQLVALADRTGQLANDYAARRDLADGAALTQIARFREGLDTVTAMTRSDAERARIVADGRMRELGEAERRRQAAEDRARAEARALNQAGQQPQLGSRKAIGTGLE